MQGLIVENVSNKYTVKCDDKLYIATARGKLKIDEIFPVVGDNVEIEVLDDNTSIINNIFPRKTYIKRPKISNISQIIFVVSMKHPKPDLLLLDKQLAYAEFMNINPVIVLNKIDLIDDEEIKKIANIYEKIGYKVIKTDAINMVGIDELKENLKNNISVFSGNSGVGKSSLINAIFEDNLTIAGEISIKNKKGKNTTTSSKLYEIGKNSYIADTPGFSTFEINEIKSIDLYKYFKEFVKEEKNCEFVGCTHIKENSCGIKNALEQGNIELSRYENYKKIYENLKDLEEHKW